MEIIKNFIGGDFLEPVSGQYLDNINPAIGAVYSKIPDSGKEDVEAAVKAAKSTFSIWSKMSAKQRADIMLKISELIDKNLEELALAETNDNGKPLWLSRSVDIPRAVSNFHFFATAILHEESHFHQTDQRAINYTYKTPIGIAGCISPWNLPLYLFTWKICPALAAGNCVVAKPSEITPMTAYLLSKICKEAGLPDGVLNIVHGLGGKAGSAIVAHPDIPAISFTGGTATGANIASVAAPMFKKLSLELGGKNPNIIFADCDFDDALKTTVRSSFSNQGQICLCGSRIFIEKALYADFRDALVERAKNIKVGDPLDEKTRAGAIASEPHQKKILSYIDLAQQEGGTVLAGGDKLSIDGRCKDGYFIAPTVIEGLDFTCRTQQEEIFGPVVTLTPFDTEEEALKMANSTPYGLSATIWTKNLKRAHRVAHQVESGIIWVNCWLLRDLRTPFGGMKQSGVGREGGFHALDFFRELKNVCIAMD